MSHATQPHDRGYLADSMQINTRNQCSRRGNPCSVKGLSKGMW